MTVPFNPIEVQFLVSIGFILSSFIGVGFIVLPKILLLAFGLNMNKHREQVNNFISRNSSFVQPSQASDESRAGGGGRRKSGRSRRLNRRSVDRMSGSMHGDRSPREKSGKYAQDSKRRNSVVASLSGPLDGSMHDSAVSSALDDFPVPRRVSRENLNDDNLMQRIAGAKVSDRLRLTSKIATMEKLLISMKEELALMEEKSSHGSKHGNLMIGSGATTNHARRQSSHRDDSLHSSLHSTLGNLPQFARQHSFRSQSPMARAESVHSRNITVSHNSTRSAISSSRRSSSISQRSNSAISMMGSTAVDESRLNALATIENTNHYFMGEFNQDRDPQRYDPSTGTVLKTIESSSSVDTNTDDVVGSRANSILQVRHHAWPEDADLVAKRNRISSALQEESSEIEASSSIVSVLVADDKDKLLNNISSETKNDLIIVDNKRENMESMGKEEGDTTGGGGGNVRNKHTEEKEYIEEKEI